MKSAAEKFPTAKRYRFCGFPIGMSMLPRFAAMVCKTIVGTRSSLPSRIVIANGTKVSSATSFVMAMLKKKQRKTRVPISIQIFFTDDKSFCASKSKNPF